MNESLTYAGQYVIDSIDILQANGHSLDIRSQVDLITLYEDLFSPFMTGNMVMIDTIDLPSLLLNGGADLLRLRLRTPAFPKKQAIDRLFHIYKLSDVAKTNDRSQSYIFYFAGVESLADGSSVISKTFKGRGNDNVKTILNGLNSTIPYIADETTNDVVYTSNYWSPVKNIAYNIDHSISNNDASFMFFENRNGFNFTTLNKLADKKPYANFAATDHIKDMVTEGMNDGVIIQDFQKDFGAILNISAKLVYDYDTDKRNGLLSNRMFTFDLVSKKFIDKTYTLNDDTRTLMNSNRFYTKNVVDTSFKGSASNIMLFNQKHTKLYNDINDVTDFKFKQKRIVALRNYQQHKVEITVFGRCDYTVGMTVMLDVNRSTRIVEEMDKNAIKNPLVSGKYIVSALAHRFSRDSKHETILELIRDSIGDFK